MRSPYLEREEIAILNMCDQQHKDPLHGVTLETMLTRLVEQYGWEKMGQIISIRCFNNDPSIKSSLQFLRRTPWARTKVEELYLKMYRDNALKKPKRS
jgi:uncharacterized protein (DUF2132 family)